jgi:hypothetical protein
MNIVRRVKKNLQDTKKALELQHKLSVIPCSRLAGIDALPIELWSHVVDYVREDNMQHAWRPYHNYAQISELRLVCREC